MPEQLRVALAAAALCVACLFVALHLWRGRVRARPPGNAGERGEASSDPAPNESATREAPRALNAGEDLSPVRSSSPSLDSLPRLASMKPPLIEYEEDDRVEPTKVGQRLRAWLDPPTERIVYDEDALIDEPTQTKPLFLLTATAQTDRGRRRKRNEDSVLARKDDGLFVVADGMGGYRGGEIASQLAVDAIARAFETHEFPGSEHVSIPKRASELARAIQAANEAILARAQQERHLEGMGTTLSAVRFSPKKQRMYVGHVGDSRVYRMRDGRFEQMTADHTMKDLGVVGEGANHLSRAVGLWPTVPIDIVLGKPQPGDVYLLCSDGLTKMVTDEQISDILSAQPIPEACAQELIRIANEKGGKDNVSVVVIRVEAASESRLAS
jgi:protein phosphatase